MECKHKYKYDGCSTSQGNWSYGILKHKYWLCKKCNKKFLKIICPRCNSKVRYCNAQYEHKKYKKRKEYGE